MLKRMRVFLEKEVHYFHPRLLFVQLLMAPLPAFVGGTVRAALLRLAGFSVGKKTAIYRGLAIVGGEGIAKKLFIGEFSYVGIQCYFDLADVIYIGNRVSLGPQAMLITGTHSIANAHNRLGPLIAKPICIEDGCWIGARCTILPGVTIGSGSVLAAGSVVTKDIPPNSLAAGVPAVVKRNLNETEVVPVEELEGYQRVA